MNLETLKFKMNSSINLIVEYTDNIYILGSILAFEKAIKRGNYTYAKKMLNRICRWYDYEIEVICHRIKDSTRQQYLETHVVLFDYKQYLDYNNESLS